MPDRFWVGGSGTWNTTSTTNWSATSGGAGGASVPTVADSVFFNQAGTYTVTMTGALACLDITVSAGTVTFATGTTPTLNIAGSMSLIAGTVWSSTATITFSSTTTGRTVTTNGTTLNGAISFNGVGGYWTLGSALTSTNSTLLGLGAGTLDTAGFALTCAGINLSFATNTRTIKLNNSTVTLNGTGSVIFLSGGSSTVTFDAGTSQINITAFGNIDNSSSGPAITLNFYNVAFTSTTAGSRTITGVNTFNNFTVTTSFATGVTTVTFNAQQTINGTLSTTGTAGNRRVFFASATYGISQDLVVNSAPSLTDADFRGLYVRGTAAPISGTRIGNRGECRNITFSTPKTVYWNLAGAQDWSANGWATTPTGTPSTDNFPLPQDTATFTNAGAVTGIISLGSVIGSVDMSGRTSAMTLALSTATVYGNWANGAGTTLTNAVTITFSGGTTQTITSAGKTFPSSITIDTYGGTVQLADALSIGTQTLTVTNGTFATQGYAVTAGILSSNNSNVRTINLGASTVTLTGTGLPAIGFTTSTNLTFNAGTSQISISYNTSGSIGLQLGGQTYNNLSVSNASTGTLTITLNGQNTFNNLTLAGTSASANIQGFSFPANQTINGTLTCAGASAVQRIFLRSNTGGTQRILTVNAISAADCDFRDIGLAGVASGASPTRAGNCGGNTGITFPAPKTVYWNLAGSQNWSATAWATSSGGTPAVNNFPLAQDTAVFDNTGAAGTVAINAVWNIGTFDASGRTSAMTLNPGTGGGASIYGDWRFGTGVTCGSTANPLTFSSGTTETITSNGVQFGCPIIIDHPNANIQLADALSLGATRGLTIATGTFDAVTYNVTAGVFSNGSSANTLRMGSGTWTLSGTGNIWDISTPPTLVSGTSTIVLSDTSTAARSFNGGFGYYNKVTIGGSTGISTLTITGNSVFGELASAKTVAHTIIFPSVATTVIGKWAVTGTVGNVVTVQSDTAATAFILSIAGPANSGIDYLSIRDCTVATTSPGEFYVGANSTNVSGNTRVIFTATPAPRTLYWVGGTGNWSSTARWSTASGGGSGAAIPTSLDAVIFNSASNATAYTATIDAGVTIARCASFTMAGPASGNVTFAGTVGIAFHGNVSFAATGITRTYTGAMNLAGNSSYTFTTNGLALNSLISINGIGATWTLGSALNNSSQQINFIYGVFDTSSASSYALSTGTLFSSYSSVRTLKLNASTVTLTTGSPSITFSPITNFTFDAGTSSIVMATSNPGITSGGLTFYNVSCTGTSVLVYPITGANTFNDLTVAGRTSAGVADLRIDADQVINGTLTLSAGTNATMRTFVRSNTIGTTRTLTCAAVAALTDIDFRDITIAGAAAPVSGTRLGDCKGNSGITFPAAKTVYFRVNSGTWGASGSGSWSLTNGGALDATAFPLAQDTAVFPSSPTPYPNSGSTVTISANYNIGTIDMSARTSNTMTLATGAQIPAIYGNWINGTGITLTGTGTLFFAGRGSQTLTSAGRTFTQAFTINTPGGAVTLQDAFTSISSGVGAFTLTAGTFDAATYNFTLSDSAGTFSSSNTNQRTLAVGSGLWSIVASGTAWNTATSTNLTVTGPGTISLTSAAAKTFAGGGANYSAITLDQGGAGTLTITGNNTFKTIARSYFGGLPVALALGATTQTLTQPWAASGAIGEPLTVSGTSATSPGTLIFSGSGTAANVDYLAINNVRAYDLLNEWYAGPNSTNGGSLGWYFVAAGGTVYAVTITETGTGTDSVTARVTLLGTITETGTGTDSVSGGLRYLGAITETGTGTDSISASFSPRATITETATGSDAESAILAAISQINETATGTDALNAPGSIYNPRLSEAATISDLITSLKGYFAYIVESVLAADAVSPRYIAQPNIAETAAGADTATTRYTARPNISEAATGTETVSPRKTTSPTVSESATGTDAETAQYVARPSIAETAAGADTAAARATFSTQITEASAAQDIVRGFMVAAGQISETATGTDQVSAIRALVAAVVETVSGADSASARAIFRGILQEIATLSDAVNAPGSTYSAPVVELATLQDAIRANAVFRSALTETATGTETVRAAFIPYANITESATITDAASALAVFAARTAESATITDQVSPPGSIYNPVVLAVAQITDQVSPPGSTYNAPVLESAAITDSLIGAYLWNLINDDQTPNWGNVENSQTVLWTAVDDSQAVSWQNVGNSQGASWDNVNDAQNPDWKTIRNV